MGSGRRTEQGRRAGEPATKVRDMEPLRRMGRAGVGGKGLHDGITCGPHGIRYNTYGSHIVLYTV